MPPQTNVAITPTDERFRPLYAIAREIGKDWLTPDHSARPYIAAMRQLDNLYDLFGLDSGRTIVGYFLANAGPWKGLVARRVKSELRRMIDR